MTSAVTASAYVREEIPTAADPAPQRAAAFSQWGRVSVGTAFSIQPEPLAIKPAPAIATASVAGGLYSGVNIESASAFAISQQSDTVVPPSPGGEQLTFYWG